MRDELSAGGASDAAEAPSRAGTEASSSSASFALDVRRGLGGRGQKQVPARYLYDALGSALFESICALPEYGISRAGERLLARHGAELARALSAPPRIVELGGGSGRKLRLLIDALGVRHVASLAAVDLSPTALESLRMELQRFSGLRVETYATSFRWGLHQALARRAGDAPVLVLFLGGNLGNYDRDESEGFLRDVRAALRPGDALLLGLDLVKPRDVLLAAYDDPLGVTAAFDKNLLARMNRELDARFDLGRFEHEARWDAEHRRVEMHLRSTKRQIVPIPGAGISASFTRGETIWTESSHKFEPGELPTLCLSAGFELREAWIDAEWPFAHALYGAV